MPKVSQKSIKLLQSRLEMVLLDFVYRKCWQGKPFKLFGTSDPEIRNIIHLHIKTLKRVYGIHIMEEIAASDRTEYSIPEEHMELARNTLNKFFDEVFA